MKGLKPLGNEGDGLPILISQLKCTQVLVDHNKAFNDLAVLDGMA